MLIIVTATIVIVGLAAIALAQPARDEILVWNDETERQLLRRRETGGSWW